MGIDARCFDDLCWRRDEQHVAGVSPAVVGLVIGHRRPVRGHAAFSVNWKVDCGFPSHIQLQEPSLEAIVHLDSAYYAGQINSRIFSGFLEHLGRSIYRGSESIAIRVNAMSSLLME
jgi:hypothetical protein